MFFARGSLISLLRGHSASRIHIRSAISVPGPDRTSAPSLGYKAEVAFSTQTQRNVPEARERSSPLCFGGLSRSNLHYFRYQIKLVISPHPALPFNFFTSMNGTTVLPATQSQNSRISFLFQDPTLTKRLWCSADPTSRGFYSDPLIWLPLLLPWMRPLNSPPLLH